MGRAELTARADTAIYRFGRELNAWCHDSARVKQTSALYDLPGRSSLGFALVYDVAPELVERLDRAMAPDAIGRLMRAPLMRPYCLQLHIVVEGWLMGREQRILDAGDRLPDDLDPDEDARDWERVGEWYGRTVDGGRRDGEMYPTAPHLYGPDGRLRAGQTVTAHPLLDEEQLTALGADSAPLPADEAARVQRAVGALELYAMTLHGEQRDGLYDHGPYRRPDGGCVVVHEVNDLRNDILPWSSDATRLPVDAVGVVRAYAPGTAVSIDMWGTPAVEPAGSPAEVRAVWTRVGDGLHELALDELEELAARAVEATTVLYRAMAAWDADYRTAYGAPLFLNALIPIARLAGAPDAEPWLWERAEAVTRATLPRLRGAPPHPAWARLARSDTDVVFTNPTQARRDAQSRR